MHHESPLTPESPYTPESATERARNIACDLELIDKSVNPDDLRFTHIIGTLREEGIFDAEIDRVKELFREDLGEFGENLESDVWEMFTVLELFDPETARHCVDTYHIAKSKVETELWNGIVLADCFEREGVNLHTFYVSCLLHDIGKVEVPHSVVINRVSDEECANLLFEHTEDILLPALRAHLKNPHFELPPNITSENELLTYLHEELHIRPQAIAPVKLLLGNLDAESVDETERQLSHVGCSLDDTLLHIMRTHDRYSKEILHGTGREVEATLAGSHHFNNESSYTITIGTLRVSVALADIIHLADVENAMLSTRHYKEKHTSLQALKVLVLHAKQGAVDSYISYLWIADTIHKMEDSLDVLDEKEMSVYTYITSHLETEKKTRLAYPDWKQGLKESSV